MHYAILGPFGVEIGARQVALGGLRARSVLALLLLNTGHVVPLDLLVDEVWDGHPPRAGDGTVRAYISRLRKALGDPATGGAVPLVTRGSGYALEVDPRQVDADEFERLTSQGRRAGDLGDHPGAGQFLRDALGLWRGPALVDFPQRWARAHATRLHELRQIAVEARVEVDLAEGRHADLAGELAALVADNPLRERLHAQRMLALYRCGRQAEALDAYRAAYQVLAGQRGINPSQALRELQAAILRQDRALDWVPPVASVAAGEPPAPDQVPAQLPADLADFTGRTDELARLDGLARTGAAAPVMAITTIAGTAGVGKTALAVHWAHRIAGRFPDGQLYVDLRGYDPASRLRPYDALTQFLRALGVAPEKIPSTEEEAAARYRSLLSDLRILVVLDNASSADQVRALLPGGTGCLVLVTSRDRLTGLIARNGARRLTIDVLSPAEAVALLERIIGTERVRAEPVAVAELAHECGYLPLALRIAAANLFDHPYRTVADHVTELRTGDRLAVLRIAGDEQSAVRHAFEQSYAELPVAAREMFRLLGLAPGGTFTVEAAAAIAGTTPSEAHATLDRLAGAHLVNQLTPDRYTFHDLLRLYARDRAVAEDDETRRAAAGQRLYDWYLGKVDMAARSLYPRTVRLPRSEEARDAGAVAAFADGSAALAWLDAERPNLVSAVTHSARAGSGATAYLLADGLRGYFWTRRYTEDWLTVAYAARAAANAAGDPRAEAAAELSLAMAYRSVTRHDRSVQHYERAMVLSERAGWRLGQTAAMNNLSCLYVRAGQLAEAERLLLDAIGLSTLAGDERAGHLCHHLGNLGYVALRQGRLQRSVDHFTRALALRRELGDRNGQADALQGLAECCHGMGRFDLAADHLAAALAIFQEIGSLDGEALIRCVRASLHCDAGRHRQAREEAQLALSLVGRTGDRYSEALARNRLGTALLRAGLVAEALEQHTHALRLARDTKGPLPEVEALLGFADAFRQQGRYDDATGAAEQAAAIGGTVGLRTLEGEALTMRAAVELDAGRPEGALAYGRQAVKIHQKAGHRLGEARALIVVGHGCERRAALGHWRAALAIAADIGLPEAERLRELIGDASLETVTAR